MDSAVSGQKWLWAHQMQLSRKVCENKIRLEDHESDGKNNVGILSDTLNEMWGGAQRE